MNKREKILLVIFIIILVYSLIYLVRNNMEEIPIITKNLRMKNEIARIEKKLENRSEIEDSFRIREKEYDGLNNKYRLVSEDDFMELVIGYEGYDLLGFDRIEFGNNNQLEGKIEFMDINIISRGILKDLIAWENYISKSLPNIVLTSLDIQGKDQNMVGVFDYRLYNVMEEEVGNE